MNKTGIEWTDFSSNPLRAMVIDEDAQPRNGWACVKVSPGCANCYAEAINKRFGTKRSYSVAGTALVEFYLHEAELRCWQKKPSDPAHNKVFVCDMTDLFQDDVPDSMIRCVFQAMAAAPWWTFQVLTKRAKRMHDLVNEWGDEGDFADLYGQEVTWPIPNVWLGVSAEDQQRANERIPWLLATSATVRFVSIEPMLGPVSIDEACQSMTAVHYEHAKELVDLHWLIIGGESGPGARSCHTDDIRDIVNAYHHYPIALGIKPLLAVFVKQLGSNPHASGRDQRNLIEMMGRGKGGDVSLWPADLRVREFPQIYTHEVQP